jgi:hypothetical protein
MIPATFFANRGRRTLDVRGMKDIIYARLDGQGYLTV